MRSELFIEVRNEELPARFVRLAEEQLRDGLLALLQGIDKGAVRTWASPRRIAVAVSDLAPARAAEDKLVTGPAAAACFKDGQPTAAAIGFARGKGVPVEELLRVDGPKGQVVAARIRTGGERSADLVREGLEALILGIRFPMSMRWRSGPARWARPIHGVIALYDGQVLQTELPHLGLVSGDQTLGHRLSPGVLTVTGADDWAAQLKAHHVLADRPARRAAVLAELERAAAEAGASLQVDPGLVEEVTDLVEWPVAVLCQFAPELLDLPPRLLVESMRVHQRVFPLWQGQRLDHRFITISNNPFARQPEAARTIATGNAKVIDARFHDAKFFFAEDRQRRLEAFGEGLQNMQWIRGGGTMADKARRVSGLALDLAPRLEANARQAARAGLLCKADLGTQMVGEFPELQGHVGRLLADFDGEPGQVPLAIEEHYLPRFAGDALPTSPEGRAVALADRLDSLAGCWGCGLRVKGSSDPLGLRRAAIGLLQLLLMGQERLGLVELFGLALVRAPRVGQVSAEALQEELVEFCMARLRALLKEQHDTEVVEAVLASTGDRDPVALLARVQALTALTGSPEFGPLKATFKRALGLVKDQPDDSYRVEAFEAPAEHALHAALQSVRPLSRAAERRLDYGQALAALAGLKTSVDRLFDEVMVMAEDPAVRANRLGLLRAVADEVRRVADLSQMSADPA